MGKLLQLSSGSELFECRSFGNYYDDPFEPVTVAGTRLPESLQPGGVLYGLQPEDVVMCRCVSEGGVSAEWVMVEHYAAGAPLCTFTGCNSKPREGKPVDIYSLSEHPPYGNPCSCPPLAKPPHLASPTHLCITQQTLFETTPASRRRSGVAFVFKLRLNTGSYRLF